MSWTDKELGMDRRITRRDFMNGAAMAIAASIAPHSSLFAQPASEAQDRPGYDPPAAHGLRGSHPGSFEVAHRLRDGTFWTSAGQPENTGESYDLIVVGGGISGLASRRAFFIKLPARRREFSSSKITMTSVATPSAMSFR